MPDKILIPAIEARLGSLLEFNRRNMAEKSARAVIEKTRPTITLSREFGCEAYPVADYLKKQLEKISHENWIVMDKGLLEEVAKNHNLSEDLLKGLGEKSSFLDEILATFSPHWKTDKDHFRLICRHMVSLAEKGNVILIGRGGAVITHSLKNCFHFRMYASQQFKIRSISQRLEISEEEADALIRRKQKLRDAFIRDFLNRDAHDLNLYNLVINNDRNTAEKTARTIAEYVLAG
ncbi:MAG: cytidylate kinase [Geobacteraceae bacterium GWC2_55_20]|nr:MAG: cytidylate kinase [Geobacteraceae bacterium GWC2_55_20]OGU19053.1 MAG: cytidylate kinase [Geobacteraceae bacterium GWF2_54_21]HBA71158.1 cytidylate kinase [Geobacter sp.]HCE69587.1 cytidylate kinase [Geobacter sp.]